MGTRSNRGHNLDGPDTERRASERPGAADRETARRGRDRRAPSTLSSYGRPERRTRSTATERLSGHGRFSGATRKIREKDTSIRPSAADGPGESSWNETGTGDWRATWERLKEGDRMRSWLQRRRAGIGKWHRPVIGLAVASAAAPLVRAGANPAVEGERVSAASATEESAEVTAERYAAMEAEKMREQAVEEATREFGIDRELAEDIHDIALEEGIDPDVAYGLVKTESSFQDRAVSHVGARGLTQLMPRTAKWMEPSIQSNEQIFEQETNLRVGFRYLRYLVDKYQGDQWLALLAYNRGPGTVDKVLSRGGNPDNGYAAKVLGP